MRINLNDRTSAQLLAMHADSGIEGNITHFLNILINEIYTNNRNTQFPLNEDNSNGSSQKAGMPIL